MKKSKLSTVSNQKIVRENPVVKKKLISASLNCILVLHSNLGLFLWFQLKWFYLGLTQFNLAERVDLSVTYVSDLELGKKFPSEKTFTKLAGALQIKPYQLLQLEEDIQPLDQALLAQIKDNLEKEFPDFLKESLKKY